MKHRFGFCVGLVLFAIVLGPTNIFAQSAPSLKTTNNFISEHLEEGNTQLKRKRSELEFVYARGCDIDLEFSDPLSKKWKEKNYEWNWGNIRDIDGAHVDIYRAIHITGFIEFSHFSRNYNLKEGSTTTLTILVDSGDRAARLIRAMKNAASLCVNEGDMPF